MLPHLPAFSFLVTRSSDTLHNVGLIIGASQQEEQPTLCIQKRFRWATALVSSLVEEVTQVISSGLSIV